MKKHLTIFFIIFLYLNTVNAQCAPGDISSQSAIDNFSTTYPGCTFIAGDLHIFGENITSLQGLSQIESVEGWINLYTTNILLNPVR